MILLVLMEQVVGLLVLVVDEGSVGGPVCVVGVNPLDLLVVEVLLNLLALVRQSRSEL